MKHGQRRGTFKGGVPTQLIVHLPYVPLTDFPNHLGQDVEKGEVGDYLRATKDLDINLIAKKRAWAQLHLLNIDPSGYKRKKSDLYLTEFAKALPWTSKETQADWKESRARLRGGAYTADEKINNFNNLVNEINEDRTILGIDPIKLSKKQVENFELNRGESFAQQAGGFTPMVGQFVATAYATGGVLNVLKIADYFKKIKTLSYLTKSGKVVPLTSVATRANKLKISPDKYIKDFGLVQNTGKGLEKLAYKWGKGVNLVFYTGLEELKMQALDPLFGTEMPTGSGIGFYLGGSAARWAMPFKFTGRVGRAVNPFSEKILKGGIGGAQQQKQLYRQNN